MKSAYHSLDTRNWAGKDKDTQSVAEVDKECSHKEASKEEVGRTRAEYTQPEAVVHHTPQHTGSRSSQAWEDETNRTEQYEEAS